MEENGYSKQLAIFKNKSLKEKNLKLPTNENIAAQCGAGSGSISMFNIKLHTHENSKK